MVCPFKVIGIQIFFLLLLTDPLKIYIDINMKILLSIAINLSKALFFYL